MEKEIERLLLKGLAPDKIVFKIKELHRNKYYQDMKKVVEDYDNTLISIESLQEQEEPLLDFEQKVLDDSLEDKSILEQRYTWLLEDKDEFGNYAIPEFTMTDEEVEAYKTENFVEFRKARFMSELGKQFEAFQYRLDRPPADP